MSCTVLHDIWLCRPELATAMPGLSLALAVTGFASFWGLQSFSLKKKKKSFYLNFQNQMSCQNRNIETFQWEHAEAECSDSFLFPSCPNSLIKSQMAPVDPNLPFSPIKYLTRAAAQLLGMRPTASAGPRGRAAQNDRPDLERLLRLQTWKLQQKFVQASWLLLPLVKVNIPSISMQKMLIYISRGSPPLSTPPRCIPFNWRRLTPQGR